MDLTPAFFDRWREHRDLQYLDRVREVLDEALLDEPWLEAARRRARALETHATLRLSGVDTGDAEDVEKALQAGEWSGPAEIGWYASAHDMALACAAQQGAVTPALLDDLRAHLFGGSDAAADHSTDAGVDALCAWLASPPDLHPAVVAALAHLDLLRMRRWPDGNARTARLLLMMLLARDGYGYRGLLSPSTHWEDPRTLPGEAAGELSPEEAETDPAVEQVVHNLHAAVREMVNWVRSEEHTGSIASAAFGWPIQP